MHGWADAQMRRRAALCQRLAPNRAPHNCRPPLQKNHLKLLSNQISRNQEIIQKLIDPRFKFGEKLRSKTKQEKPADKRRPQLGANISNASNLPDEKFKQHSYKQISTITDRNQMIFCNRKTDERPYTAQYDPYQDKAKNLHCQDFPGRQNNNFIIQQNIQNAILLNQLSKYPLKGVNANLFQDDVQDQFLQPNVKRLHHSQGRDFGKAKNHINENINYNTMYSIFGRQNQKYGKLMPPQNQSKLASYINYSNSINPPQYAQGCNDSLARIIQKINQTENQFQKLLGDEDQLYKSKNVFIIQEENEVQVRAPIHLGEGQFKLSNLATPNGKKVKDQKSPAKSINQQKLNHPGVSTNISQYSNCYTGASAGNYQPYPVQKKIQLKEDIFKQKTNFPSAFYGYKKHYVQKKKLTIDFQKNKVVSEQTNQ